LNKLERIGFGLGVIFRIFIDLFKDLENGVFHGYSVEFMTPDGEFDDDEEGEDDFGDYDDEEDEDEEESQDQLPANKR
jgi:hypothetical protein